MKYYKCKIGEVDLKPFKKLKSSINVFTSQFTRQFFVQFTIRPSSCVEFSSNLSENFARWFLERKPMVSPKLLFICGVRVEK